MIAARVLMVAYPNCWLDDAGFAVRAGPGGYDLAGHRPTGAPMISPNATLYCLGPGWRRMELRRSSAPPEAKSYSPAKKPVDLIACWMYLARSTAPAWSGTARRRRRGRPSPWPCPGLRLLDPAVGEAGLACVLAGSAQLVVLSVSAV